jgi:hypothetical protein
LGFGDQVADPMPTRAAAVKRCYRVSGDEIASIGRLLTERWHPLATMSDHGRCSHRRGSRNSGKKLLHGLRRSAFASRPSLRIPRLLSNLYNIKKCSADLARKFAASLPSPGGAGALLSEVPAYLAQMALLTVNTGRRDQKVCSLRWEWELATPQLETSASSYRVRSSKTATSAWLCSIGLQSVWRHVGSVQRTSSRIRAS